MKRNTFMAKVLFLTLIGVSISAAGYCISWSNSLSDGIKEAKSKQKPVMVDFYTDWCGWCKKLDKDTYSNPKVQNLAQKFICVKVNGDKFNDLVAKYAVQGYPTIIFLDPSGKEISRIVGYLDGPSFSAKMSEIAAKYKK